MSEENFKEGRKHGFEIVEKILESRHKYYETGVLTGFSQTPTLTGKDGVQEAFNQAAQNYLTKAGEFLSRLKNGEDTNSIRPGVIPHIGQGTTKIEGKISALRDHYNLFMAVVPNEISVAPPASLTTGKSKKVFEDTQTDMLKVIRTDISVQLETAAKKLLKKEMTKPPAAANLNTLKNTAPTTTVKNTISADIVAQFEDKALLSLASLDTDEQERLQTLQDILVVFENYKSALKATSFHNLTQSPAHSTFCETHAYKVIEAIRGALLAMIKGAHPDDVCEDIKKSDTQTTGRDRAIHDAAIILNAIASAPDSIPVDHSAGYKISHGEMRAQVFAREATGRTIKDLAQLLDTVAKNDDIDQILRSGVIAAMTRVRVPKSAPQQTTSGPIDPFRSNKR